MRSDAQMNGRAYKSYEREIRSAVDKKPPELTENDRFVLSVIERAQAFFRIYDEVENKNTYETFCALFLTGKNRRKSMLEYADELGLCVRSLLRHKRKLLRIFACIYEKCRK